MEISSNTDMTTKFKIKDQYKNFSEDEDNLLISIYFNNDKDPVDGNQ
jgi:hypothetical protein